MAKVPTYDSQASLQPTLVNPNTAARLGGEVIDVSQGLSGMAGKIKEMNDTRQSLNASIALTEVDQQNWRSAATDPDLDKVGERIRENSRKGIESAAKLISSPDARSAFVNEATLEMDRKQVHLDQHIFTRQSEDTKEKMTIQNEQLVSQYKDSADPQERMLIKAKSYRMTEDLVRKGLLHDKLAREHLNTLWHKALIEQVKDDAAVDPEHTGEQLQKGKEGLYGELSDHERKSLFETVQKQIKKQGIEDNYIMGIAQNHTDNMLLDKMADHTLTMDDISNARLGLGYPAPATPGFAKLAQEALEDPFPTGTSDAQRLEAYNLATDPNTDPAEARNKIFKIRGLTSGEKTKIVNWALRPDESGTNRSLNFLVNDGLKKNKQELLERNKQVQESLKERRGWFSGVMQFFNQNAGQEDTARMMNEFADEMMDKNNKIRTQQEMANVAKDIVKKNVMKNHPETMALEDTPNDVVNFKDGVKSVFSAPSNAGATHEIRDGKIVEKSAPVKETKYKKGQEIIIRGKKYRAMNDGDDPDVELIK